MAESTLSLSIVEINASLGAFLGYGRGSVTYGETAWTTPQTNNINENRKSGLTQFYTPPSLRPEKGEPSHNWSFMRPFANITLTEGVSTVDLPDNFGGFEGPLYVSTPETAARQWQLKVTNEGAVQHMIASQPETTGYPRICAEQSGVIPGTATEGTRSRLLVWPIPDTEYVLKATYRYHPDDLVSGVMPYPPGGAEHGETIKLSCLAAAELFLDNERGVMWLAFIQRLQASIDVDRKRKGINLGKNIDRSDWQNSNVIEDLRRRGWGPVTLDGTEFD